MLFTVFSGLKSASFFFLPYTVLTIIRSAYAGSDWLLPHGLIGSGSSSVVSARDVDSSSWLSGVTAPPDREHSVCSSYMSKQQ